MADAVDTQILFTGNNMYSIRITGVSDGTGESDVIKIDKSTLIGPNGVDPAKIRIDEVTWDLSGWDGINLEWDGTTDAVALVLSTNGYKDYRPDGGLISDNTDGTGDLLLSTIGTGAAGYTYVIYLRCRLKGGV